MKYTIYFFILILTYLLASISSAIIICKFAGLDDPRASGSCNPGATNVLRIGGKFAAVLTLLFDALKGLLPTLLATKFWGINLGASVALAAILGHMFSAYHNFKGGKSVATSIGSYLGLDFVFGMIIFAIWLITLLFTRISAVAGVSASLSAVILAYLRFGWLPAIIIAIAATLIIFKHKANLIRIFAGTEPNIC